MKMPKIQRTITIDKQIDEELRSRPHLNVSALTNMLLTEYVEELKKHE